MRVKRVHQHLHRNNKEFRNRRIRLRVILGIALIAIVAALLVTYRALSVSAHADSNPTHRVVQHNAVGPESIGIRYGQPTSPPQMTQQQAIHIATTRLGSPLASQATSVKATYVLFSDDQYYSTGAKGQRHYFFQNVPAWVVTFEGVNFPGQGHSPTRLNHEVNVVINDHTGAFIEQFSYR